MPAPNIISFKQPESEPLPDRQIQAAAHNGSDSIACIQTIDRYPVEADHGVHKIVRIICPPNEARTNRSSGFIIPTAPVVAEVCFQTPMRIEIVCNRTAETPGHIG